MIAVLIQLLLGMLSFGNFFVCKQDKEIVALSGAHTLGSCHRTRSGFDGPWTHNPLKVSGYSYSRNYGRLARVQFVTHCLFSRFSLTMSISKTCDLKWTKREWDGPEQYQDESGTLMMLPTDMALIQDDGFLPFVKQYAEDEQAFFRDFAEAFAALLAKGCPAHCQPDAKVPPAPGASADKDFRDLAMHGSLERMKEVYSNGGVDPNSTEPHSLRTAAHKAAFFGHANVIEYLGTLEGINLNACDADGDTPLHDAARFGHTAVVEALLRAGVDKTVKNNEDKLPADVAAANGHDGIVA